MKNLILTSVALLAALASVAPAPAQEKASREEALKAAFTLFAHHPEIAEPPITVDPDLKYPSVVHKSPYGAVVLPETKLSAKSIATAGKTPVPIGELWLRGLMPRSGGESVRLDQVFQADIDIDGSQETIALVLIGLRADAEGKREIVLFGKEGELLAVRLEKPSDPAASAPADGPLDIFAYGSGGQAELVLTLPTGETATFPVSKSE